MITGFRFDETALTVLLRSPSGGVARDLARRAIRVESAAKQNFHPGPRVAPGPPGPISDSGRLRSSITWVLGQDGFGIFADIGSNVAYSKYVEDLYPYLRPALSAAGG